MINNKLLYTKGGETMMSKYIINNREDQDIINLLKARYDYISKFNAISFLHRNGYTKIGLKRFIDIYDYCYN